MFSVKHLDHFSDVMHAELMLPGFPTDLVLCLGCVFDFHGPRRWILVLTLFGFIFKPESGRFRAFLVFAISSKI